MRKHVNYGIFLLLLGFVAVNLSGCTLKQRVKDLEDRTMRLEHSMYSNMVEKNVAALMATVFNYPADSVIHPPRPKEQKPCPGDQDCDGFTDGLEEMGFSIYNGQISYEPCNGNEPVGSDGRAACVDPNSRDLFVILKRSSQTLIPPSSTFKPFEYVSKEASTSVGGLGITVHEISETWVPPERQVTQNSPQKAVLIQEDTALSDFSSSDCSGTLVHGLGITSDPLGGDDVRGTPMDGLISKVRTKQIVGFIDHYCKNASSCKELNFSSNGVEGVTGECDLDGGVVTMDELDDLDKRFIKHVIAHEVGHNVKLTYSETQGIGWHHPTDPDEYKIMEYLADVDPDTGDVVFHIADYFCNDCRVARRLWE